MFVVLFEVRLCFKHCNTDIMYAVKYIRYTESKPRASNAGFLCYIKTDTMMKANSLSISDESYSSINMYKIHSNSLGRVFTYM